jgi:hypothetical protein
MAQVELMIRNKGIHVPSSSIRSFKKRDPIGTRSNAAFGYSFFGRSIYVEERINPKKKRRKPEGG